MPTRQGAPVNRRTYRTLATATSAVAVAGMLAAPTAWAQETEALAVTAAQACGRVTLTATVGQNFGDNDTYEIGVFSGPNAGDADTKLEGQFRVSADPGTATQTFTLDEDAYAGSGFVRWVTLSGPNPEFYVSGVVGVDTDCAPPVEPGPEPTPDPNPEPEPTTPAPDTTEPTPEPTPSDEPVPTTPVPPASDSTTPDPTGTAGDPTNDTDAAALYENCAAVRDADAAPLYATDPGYRLDLDSDGDGVACETDTLYSPSGDEDFSQTGDVPIGSAETGQA